MTFEEIPAPLRGIKLWGAYGIKRQYVIMQAGEDFTASAKEKTLSKSNRNKTHYLIPYDQPVKTFEEAKAVCEADNTPIKN